MRRVPDLHAVGGSLEVTQLLEIDAETTLTMVEIRAHATTRTCTTSPPSWPESTVT